MLCVLTRLPADVLPEFVAVTSSTSICVNITQMSGTVQVHPGICGLYCQVWQITITAFRTPKCQQGARELLRELVVWSCNIGCATGTCDDLIDGHNFSLNAIQETSTELVPPVGCCIGAIGPVIVSWVGPGSQVKDVYLRTSSKRLLRCLSNMVQMHNSHSSSAC